MKALLLILASLLTSELLANFSHESEVSVMNMAGNTELETYNARTKNHYIFNDLHDMSIGGHYNASEFNGDIETAHNWDVNMAYGYILNKRLDLKVGYQYERDKFARIDYRTNMDAGVNIKFQNTDKVKTHAYIGVRRTVEQATYVQGFEEVDKIQDTKGRIFLEREQKISKTVTYNLHMEYLPNFTTEEDYQVNSGGYVHSALTSIFFLKVGYENRYDNMPVDYDSEFATELKKFDSVFTTSLLAKF